MSRTRNIVQHLHFITPVHVHIYVHVHVHTHVQTQAYVPSRASRVRPHNPWKYRGGSLKWRIQPNDEFVSIIMIMMMMMIIVMRAVIVMIDDRADDN